MPDTLVTRRRRDTDKLQLEVGVSVVRKRIITVRIPDGIPYDDEDMDEIERQLDALSPPPSNYQLPVPDGLGSLVFDEFYVEFEDDPRSAAELKRVVVGVVRAGLADRVWLCQGSSQPRPASCEACDDRIDPRFDGDRVLCRRCGEPLPAER